MQIVLAAALAAASLAWIHGAGQLDDRLTIRVVRFYRADHQHTRVTAFLEIPYAAVANPVGSSVSGTYQVTVRVCDSSGAVLHSEAWTSAIPATAQAGGSVVETIEFTIPSGRYRLEAEARNAGTGREAHATLELEGFQHPPAVSDLMVSSAIRLASVGDTVPQPGELRQSGALVTAAALPRLDPERTTAHYLLEVYATGDHETVGSISLAVRDSTGAIVSRWKPAPVRVQPGGSTLHGHVNLAGLRPGRYRLIVSVAVAGRVSEREAEVEMDSVNGEQ